MNKVVVGIDFGTTGIGYAYSFSGENPNSITLSDLPGQSADNKVPSEIILDNYLKDVLAFGAECKGYISTNHQNEYEYYKDIKMNLYKRIYTIKSTNGKEADIELIITKMLKRVSENAITQIQRANKEIKKEDIKWVVTIPAIWEENSKQIMINASIEAGLIDKNTDKSLFLALEPEVAGIYYYISSLYGSEFNCEHIKEGKPYIICDIGGGTVDICTHRRIMNDNKTSELIEEYPPIGGDYGGNKINEEFIKRFIYEIFGEENVNKLKANTDETEDWNKFEKEIEEKKISCCENKPDFLTIDCALFQDLDPHKKDLDVYISEYNLKEISNKYKIKKKRRWELAFDSQIFYDIIKEISQKIFSKIEEIHNNVNTGYILITGAGSNNHVIANDLYNLSKEKKIKIEIETPPNPEISIMKGAVLFGFQSNIIRKRKAKYTLGISASKEWEVKFEGKGIKYTDEISGKDICINAFSKFITKNQYIDFRDVIRKDYKTKLSNPEIVFYRADKENCDFIDEKDENGELIVEEFGRVKFNFDKDFDEKNPEIYLTMKLGGTYIDVSAVYKKTRKKINTTQSFN